LPDGLWQSQLSAEEVYQWTFDGRRARLSLNDGEWACDADATAEDSAVRLTWHEAMGCGGYDTIAWSLEADGLVLSLVENGSGDEAGTRDLLEGHPWLPVDGDATLSWSDGWLTCSNPDQGACLDTLAAGTYTTDAFQPGLTYTMPEGWQNLSDLQGEVFFLAPGQSLEGVNAGGSDYIGVYTSVRALNRRCRTEAEAASDQPGVARTPQALAAEFQARRGLATTTPRAVSIGGLSGLVMDISMAADWTGTCFYLDEPAVQLMGGVAPSDFEHGILRDLTMRLYLLRRGDSTLAIEIDDYSNGANLDAYSRIVEAFEFGS
jgi:hypothetical protein